MCYNLVYTFIATIIIRYKSIENIYMTRKILHIDLDAFFCAVEEIIDPTLQRKPFAVGGKPETRGVVSSCSYAARIHGIRSAMPMARAVRLCPSLIIVAPSHKIYNNYSQQVMQQLRQVSSQLEQISIDEAFLDISEINDDSIVIAQKIQNTIISELNLPCSIGVATNKLVAKTATDFGKATNQKEGPPNAITIVKPGNEAEFLSPLPAEALWGVGPKTASKLEELGILTIGDITNWPEQDLVKRFGKYGYELSQRAKGVDNRPIVTSRESKSMSKEITFEKDITDRNILLNTLKKLSSSIGVILKKSHKTGKTIKLKIRWHDFVTINRQTTKPHPTDDGDEIYIEALSLFESIWDGRKPIRLIGVRVTGFNSSTLQLSLWDQEFKKKDKLNAIMKDLRNQYGDQIIYKGDQLSDKNKSYI
jgi:DNA polymerase-4